MKKCKILHIEDVAADAELAARELKKYFDFEHLVVDKEEDYRAALNSFSPDVILCDHSLPSFNSLEALKIVQTKGLSVPFILVTATVSEEFAVEVIKQGADDYILKDRLSRLPVAVHNALEKNRLEKEKQDYLAAEELVLRSLVEGASVATALYTGRHFRITYVNNIMLDYWGKDRSVVGKTFRTALPELKDHPFSDLLNSVFNSGIAYESPEAEINRMMQGQFTKRYYRFTYKPMFDKAGQVWGIHHMAQDVTEQVLARLEIEEAVKERTKELWESNEALLNSNKELNRSNKHLEEFAHAASHDLKEPIRKIRVFTGRLKEAILAGTDEQAMQLLNRMENAEERMYTLVDDLLLYSHFSVKPIEKEAIDLNEELKCVLEDLELHINEKQAVVKSSQLPVVQGYKRQLQQILQNLISNAIKYCHADIAPLITITASIVSHEAADYHLIEIADNGIGFEQQYADRIFQMFTRLHSKHEFGGTGIGLAIVKKIVENHSGFVQVESEINKGSAFRVFLPVAEV